MCPSKVMLLAEAEYGSIHLLYLREHIYAISIVGQIIWVLYLEAASLVPPSIGSHVRAVNQHDPILRITVVYVV